MTFYALVFVREIYLMPIVFIFWRLVEIKKPQVSNCASDEERGILFEALAENPGKLRDNFRLLRGRPQPFPKGRKPKRDLFRIERPNGNSPFQKDSRGLKDYCSKWIRQSAGRPDQPSTIFSKFSQEYLKPVSKKAEATEGNHWTKWNYPVIGFEDEGIPFLKKVHSRRPLRRRPRLDFWK